VAQHKTHTCISLHSAFFIGGGGRGGQTKPHIALQGIPSSPDPHLLFSLIVHAGISRESFRWIRPRRLSCRPLPWWHTVGTVIAAASHVFLPRDVVSKQLR